MTDDAEQSRKSGRRNVVIVLGAAVVLALAAWLLRDVVRPRPVVRQVLFVVNGPAGEASLSVGGALLERIPAGGWKRIELSSRSDAAVALVLESPGAAPLRCDVPAGAHVVNASDEVRVTWEEVHYAAQPWVSTSKPRAVGRGCWAFAAVGQDVFGFDEEPPQRIEVEVDRHRPAFALVTRYKLRRETIPLKDGWRTW